MIKLQGKLDREVWLACSGGIDSMAAADFLSRNHKVNLMFFDHGTQTSFDAMNFLKDYCSKNKNMNLSIGELTRDKLQSESWEEYWRHQRYEWFHLFDHPIITCHHLDDCVETWIWSSMHGQGKIIPYRNKNVIRPFRLNKKTDLINWSIAKKVPHSEDKSNYDTKYMRNYIRSELVERCLVVNPGLHKVIAKKVIQDAPSTP